MDNNMVIFDNDEFGKVRVVKKNGDNWFVAKDICDCVGLEVRDSVRYLDDEEKSYVSREHIGLLPGKDIVIINESGLYSLILRSRKPEAKKFKRWVTSEVLPTIRKTGEYSTPEVKRRKADKKDELALRRIEVMEKNADYRMAKLILEGIDKFSKVMTPESMTVFMATYAELTTKQDMTHMLPQATEPMYSATDIGKECGVSAQMVGKTANEHGLKSPQGESGQFGTWIRSKSQHSEKEVMTFVYNDNGRNWFLRHFGVMATA